MRHLFIPYELALLAKEKGFDDPCLAYYYDLNIYTGKNARDDLMLVPIQQHEKITYKGFRPTKNGFGNWYISAPLYQQIIDWFEITFHVRICPIPYTSGHKKYQIWQWNRSKELWEDSMARLDDANKAIEESFKLI